MKTLFYLLLLLTAQTLRSQSVVETKYANGLVKTRYHIQQKDTFLTEYFHPNGKIDKRTWRSDSSHIYRHGQLVGTFYGQRPQANWYEQIPMIGSRYIEGIGYDSIFEYYPNRKVKKHFFWTCDSVFNQIYFLSNGTRRATRTYKQNSYLDNDLDSQMEVIIDTVAATETINQWKNGQLLERIERDSMSSWSQQMNFDTATGKIDFLWKRDDNQRLILDKNTLSCLYGFRNKEGDWVIPPKYESVKSFNKAYYIVNEGHKYGILNQYGQIMIPTEWDFLEPLSRDDDKPIQISISNPYSVDFRPLANARLRCRKGNKYGVVANDGKIILEPVYQAVRNSNKNLFEVRMGSFWGIVNHDGQIVVAPKYVSIDFTSQDDLFITVDTIPNSSTEDNDAIQKLGLVNDKGQILLNQAFSKIDRPKNRAFWVKTSSESPKIGLFHAERGWLLDTISITLSNMNKRHAPSPYLLAKYQDTLMGAITPLGGKVILPFEYQYIKYVEKKAYQSDFSEDNEPTQVFFICEKQNKYGIFNPQTQQWMIPLKYDGLQDVSDSVFLALHDKKWRFINLQDQILLPESYDEVGMRPDYPYAYFAWGQKPQQDRLLFYTAESFPFTVALSEMDHEETPIQEAFSFNRGAHLLYYNQQARVVAGSEDSILAMNGTHLITQNKHTKQRQIIDNQGNKKLFLSKYKILKLLPALNSILLEDTSLHKLGMMTLDEKIILPCQYFGITTRDAHPVIWAKKEVAPLPVDVPAKLRYFERSVADENWQMFDSTGKLLSDFHFDYPFEWANHLGIGQVNDKQGLWNHQGMNILPARYDKIWYDTLSKIFHLFRLKNGRHDKIGFANADGQLIIDTVLSNMSVFNGDYALVATDSGNYGIIRRNGQYWIEPRPNALQKTPFNVMTSLANTAIRKSGNYSFQIRYDESNDSMMKKVDLLDTAQKRLLDNLALEQVIEHYFLKGDYVWMRRNKNRVFESPFQLNLYEAIPLGGGEYLDDISTNVADFAITTKGISLALSRSKSNPIKNKETTHYCSNFKLENNIWVNQSIESILFLNESNKTALNRLLITKLGEMKNVDIACGDPTSYFQKVQNRFYILPKGLKFYVPKWEDSAFDSSVPVLLTWEELKPFLNY
jgi:WG containing repeat